MLILDYADSCLLQILFHRGLRLFPLKGFDWNLKELYDLSQAYEEIKGDIHFFVNLYRLIKSAGMNSQQVIRLLTIASIHLPSVEYRYENLKREEASLQAGNHNSARTLQSIRNTLQQYESDCEEKRLKMTKLQIQKIGAEYCLVKVFKTIMKRTFKSNRW